MNSGVLRETVISRPLSVLQFRNPLDCRGNQLWNGRAGRHALLVPLICSLSSGDWSANFGPHFSPRNPLACAHTQMRNWLPNTTDPLRLTLSGNSWARGAFQHPVTSRVKASSMGIKESGLKIVCRSCWVAYNCGSCREKLNKKIFFFHFIHFQPYFSQSIATRSPWYLN